jgi:hypothetical protein
MTHQLSYKGHNVFCENGLYWIEHRGEKYVSFNDCKKLIDTIESNADLNISTNIQRKATK